MRIISALVLVFVCGIAYVQSVYAQTTTSGKVINLFADPSDVVIELDTNGRCKSAYFHVQRTSTNFKEMTAVAMTAFTTGKTITFFVASCTVDRNIVSHGFVSR